MHELVFLSDLINENVFLGKPSHWTFTDLYSDWNERMTAADRMHRDGTELCQETFRLDIMNLLTQTWFNTGAGFLVKQLISHACQCSRSLGQLSLRCCNIWLALKRSGTWSRGNVKVSFNFLPYCCAKSPMSTVTFPFKRNMNNICKVNLNMEQINLGLFQTNFVLYFYLNLLKRATKTQEPACSKSQREPVLTKQVASIASWHAIYHCATSLSSNIFSE